MRQTCTNRFLWLLALEELYITHLTRQETHTNTFVWSVFYKKRVNTCATMIEEVTISGQVLLVTKHGVPELEVLTTQFLSPE